MDEEKDQNSKTEGQEEQVFVSGEKSMGLILGLIIVVIILIVAAFYFLGDNPNDISINPEPNNNVVVIPEDNNTGDVSVSTTSGEISVEDNTIKTLENQGTTDEVDEIVKDLEATQIDDLTTELDDMEAEMGL